MGLEGMREGCQCCTARSEGYARKDTHTRVSRREVLQVQTTNALSSETDLREIQQ